MDTNSGAAAGGTDTPLGGTSGKPGEDKPPKKKGDQIVVVEHPGPGLQHPGKR